ncbi:MULTISPECIES: hypothetical protein [Thalassospira]|jgi:hypothetical protein|uniref:Uncharacterized protein n=2 Tax=Thalassospira xiamenensis TaxID=220697 RepID=A0AB72UBA7_9PROT|nr:MULTISPECIES: hypothetical protein [Thalassospira]MBL4843642.1 hypothetical protein [Thalassospira sp.]MBR9779796.1 hypothetical protein [Rhodospirillales bacterium]AJD51513.1 hypothetical protein TH3_06965 [Thalassospira xiamenensis M-5 = DSM 17429]KZD07647.1 hypothetical protein AUP45_18715 [Thalassospira xiamenensis]MBR9818791.1 hypothetical protein [Rhodospirillales bacterium]|tara:strand:+ start:63 stop:578 length:516 start_codon:yes stop_codon:yes gene_type:complete
MFSFWMGRKFANSIASYLDINASLLSSALLEVGITWYQLKLMKKSGMTIREAAEKLLPAITSGIDVIERKFGQQGLIVDARKKLNDFEVLISKGEMRENTQNRYVLRFYVEDDFQRIRGKPVLTQLGDDIFGDDLQALTLFATPPFDFKGKRICQIREIESNQIVFSTPNE